MRRQESGERRCKTDRREGKTPTRDTLQMSSPWKQYLQVTTLKKLKKKKNKLKKKKKKKKKLKKKKKKKKKMMKYASNERRRTQTWVGANRPATLRTSLPLRSRADQCVTE
jgi:hypothetical protein